MQMTLFDRELSAPLAARLRPANLDEYVGQENLLGPGKVLRSLIERDQICSMIFWGPPGVGKTSLARIIAAMTRSNFVDFSAVQSGIKEIREVMKTAEASRLAGERTILFVDEIHRFNKAQQDAFLPYVEKGSIILIGATTENPSFEINSALLSRCKVFVLNALTSEDILKLLKNALSSPKGFGREKVEIGEDLLSLIANFANGDARTALNTLEMAVLNGIREGDVTHVTRETLAQCVEKKSLLYDKNGEEHYNLISALHKSMRNSDPDAAVYWLARMLEAGEDPKFIARRIMICAAEDVGNADPRAITVAVSCSLACERIGLPEAQILLAQAASYVACAPKSNAAVNAIFAARDLVNKTGNLPVPPYLQDAHYKGAQQLGRGIGYQYAHLYRGHYSGQPYMPEEVRGTRLYEPSENGYEEQIRARLYELTGDSRYQEPEELLDRDPDSGRP